MRTEWLVIEAAAAFVDGLAKVYFLHSRFAAERKSAAPEFLAWLCLFVLRLAFAVYAFPSLLYDCAAFLVMAAYLFLSKQGTPWQKLFGALLTATLSLACFFAGTGLASFLTGDSLGDTLTHRDSSLLLALILIRSIQVILFYALARRERFFYPPQKRTLFVLSGTVILIFSCLRFALVNLSDFDAHINDVLLWLAAGLLCILIAVFLLHEFFARAEERLVEQSAYLRHLETETRYFQEIAAMQGDFRIWRHEYENHMLTLRGLLQNSLTRDALAYLDAMGGGSDGKDIRLRADTSLLSALVNAKLSLARAQGIQTDIQIVVPRDNPIADRDLCAIAGNLLDNAVEACARMGGADGPRFVSFVLLLKGKNLFLTIRNSYAGEIRRAGERFVSAKEKPLHGLGIGYVDKIVDKYQGFVLREYENGVFETNVMLPLLPPPLPPPHG